MSAARILIADAEAEVRRSLAKSLLLHGFEVLSAGDADAMLTMLHTARSDVLVLDLAMREPKNPLPFELLRRVRREHPGLPVLGLGASSEMDEQSSALLSREVFALIPKSILGGTLLVPLIRRALEHRTLERQVADLLERLAQHEAFGSLVGSSKSLVRAHKLALALGPGASHVLIEGEPGTGKALFARLIHRHSRRADRPLLILRCDALSEALLEQTLFGEASALSAAMPAQAGLWAAAERGTLLLADVSALSPALQSRLARALFGFEDAAAEQVSPGKRRDVRVIATSSSELSGQAAAGRFREDLRLCLSAARLELPPLRQRKDDILLLAYHFAHQAARANGRSIRRISVEALRMLRAYAWPGNVRELKETVEHAVLSAQSDMIVAGDLALERDGEAVCALGAPRAIHASLELSYAEAKEQLLLDFERGYVALLMAETDSNVSEAARRAGMDRSNFRRMLKRVRASALR